MRRSIAFVVAFAYGIGLCWIGGMDFTTRSPELAGAMAIATFVAGFAASFPGLGD
jgi:hypothetical protein